MKTTVTKNRWVGRDAQHRARDARAPRECRGLTILEMLVSTAMLSFIVLGLTAMFIQTQKAFKTGIKQTSVTDAGRAVIDMIASDLSQMADPHFTNFYNPYFPGSGTWPHWTNFSYAWVPAYDLYQYTNNASGAAVLCRVNELEDIFAMVQTNNSWIGVGYAVSNWFTGTGGQIPGVGTLYRYVTNTPIPLTNSVFLNTNFTACLGTFTNFHRIADGVVHLKIYSFDASGNEDPWDLNTSTQYPTVVQYPPYSGIYQTNYLPHSVDIEVGILEPDAFEHARALYTSGATAAASNYLATAVGQVQIFRQHIIIPAAP